MRLRLAPIIGMLAVVAVVVLLIYAIYAAAQTLPSLQALVRDAPWLLAHLVHIPQFAVPFCLICWITRGRVGEYGLNLGRQAPPQFGHARMLALGLVFGLVMSLRYVPALLGGMPVDIPRPVNLGSIAGNMTFQWLVVGLSEETMFRGLIQTHLMKTLDGRVQMLGHELHIGTVIAAIIWGLFHLINVLIMPLGSALFTVALTTVAGLLMGYAYQRTRSLLTTIIVHNTIFGLPLTIGYLLYWLR